MEGRNLTKIKKFESCDNSFQIDTEEYEKRIATQAKDKLKMFIHIICDFEAYIRAKKDKDKQLEIDKVLKTIINEVIMTENLKIFLIHRDSNEGVNALVQKKKERLKWETNDGNTARGPSQITDRLNNNGKDKFNNSDNDFDSSDGDTVELSENKTQYYRTITTKSRNITTSEAFTTKNDNFTLNPIKSKRGENNTCFNQKNIRTSNLFYSTRNEINNFSEKTKESIKKKIMNKFYMFINNNIKVENKKNFVLTHIHKSIGNVNNFNRISKSNRSQSLQNSAVSSPKNNSNLPIIRNFGRIINNSNNQSLNNSPNMTKSISNNIGSNFNTISVDDYINNMKQKTKYPIIECIPTDKSKLKHVYSSLIGIPNVIINSKPKFETIQTNKINNTRNHNHAKKLSHEIINNLYILEHSSLVNGNSGNAINNTLLASQKKKKEKKISLANFYDYTGFLPKLIRNKTVSKAKVKTNLVKPKNKSIIKNSKF